MAIALEHINFIVRRLTIEEKYPGGWEQCLIDHASSLGTRVWYDEHLFRDGAMNPIDMENLVNAWRDIGFQAILINGGQILKTILNMSSNRQLPISKDGSYMRARVDVLDPIFKCNSQVTTKECI
jgi:hypothetical protein